MAMCHFVAPAADQGILMSKTLPPEVLDLIAERFRVLAEPSRLRILNLLLGGERSVSDLVDETGLNQANVSKHLGLLRSHHFVERRKEGLYSFYSVADESVGLLCEIMCDRLEAQAEEQNALLGTGS
jgi:DNA-binding transcriptional ArsR family regulator